MSVSTKFPVEIGPIHFIGIGGIGMSGIAEVMLNLGYTVQGSDIKENPNVARLREKGAEIHIGHAAENVQGAGALVVSTAIKPGNPELVAARAGQPPVLLLDEVAAHLDPARRAALFARLARLGQTWMTGTEPALFEAAGDATRMAL